MSNEIELGKINLTGGKAVAALVVIVAIVGYRYFTLEQTLREEALQALKLQLQGEYASVELDELDKETLQTADRNTVKKKVQNVLDTQAIEFTDVSAKGSSKDVVVRLEIEVAGKTPPDGKSVRYYRVERRPGGGWRVKHEVGSWSYYLKLW